MQLKACCHGSCLARRQAPLPDKSSEGSPVHGQKGCGRCCSSKHHFLGLALGATGVVFGDIGTSPLYTFTGIFDELHGTPHRHDVAGAFSVIFWSLTWIVCFKYLLWVMGVTHHGEGGTFALMQVALSGGAETVGPRLKGLLVLLGIVGCSLIVGDGAITPVISVLGALEGLPSGLPRGGQVAIAVAILLLIFLLQRMGARFIGLIAGPVMVTWFLSIGLLGVYNLALRPDIALEVMAALSPARVYHFFCLGVYRGYDAWRALAGAVLCVTGAEALYADMGYFGRGPISFAWLVLVYPCLVLQYMGQSAVLMADPQANPFWDGVPLVLKVPMAVLAPLAAVVASQALISGVFSLLTQAHALDFLPRVLVCHTNPDEPHQVYIPEVNWLLCAMCVALCLAFQRTSALAGAYGITVTCSFAVTTALFCTVLLRVWGWRWLTTLALTLPMIAIDIAFLSSNALKIADSGWVPVVISILVCMLLYVHHWGRCQEDAVFETERMSQMPAAEECAEGTVSNPVPLDCICTVEVLRDVLRLGRLGRTKAIGVFLTPKPWRVPRSLGALAKTLGCLPGTIILLSFRFETASPYVEEQERVAFDVLDEDCGVYRLVISLGYAEPLTAERLAVRATLAHVAAECSARYPALTPLVPVPVRSDVDEESVAAASSNGTGSEAEAAKSAATFVFSRLYYATKPNCGAWTCFRVCLYSWLVLSARQPISFFGLEEENTLEVSTVRFM